MHKRYLMSQNLRVDGDRMIGYTVRMLLAWVILGGSTAMAKQVSEPREADRMLSEYFESETRKLQDRCLSDAKTLDDWKARREVYRHQLLEMLGLEPFPDRTPLQATITGTAEHEQFTVENLHYQSMPGLYVTGNLYVPKNLDKPAPAILYVCGHGAVRKDGVSYGNKVAYQHHGAWFARHGFVCLTIDTLQLGEIEGIHHGTYRYGMWWWNSRGYTPAGVEAWNCVRALDYLETRKEVDPNRFGVTGRSGGGAYSWWIAAIDDRIKAAVPVAGITDLQNHVVDGCVEGHCDCMFIVNTYQWDYPMVAALVAPRPLLISNSDKDRIFPLDGVLRVHQKVREIYRLYDAEKNLGLQITEGPHKDTQELRIHSFVWFNRFLRDEDPVISEPAVPFFEPEQLRVFKVLPADQINTKIHETFVRAAAPPAVRPSGEVWGTLCEEWLKALREKVFRAWPTPREAGPLDVDRVFSAEADSVRLTACDFTSQPHVRLRLFLIQRTDVKPPGRLALHVLDEAGWAEWLAAMRGAFERQLDEYVLPDADPPVFRSRQNALKADNAVLAYICPRGIGPGAWSGDERRLTHIQRRFMLLGQTVDGMRVWDVRRALQVLRELDETRKLSPVIIGRGNLAGIALYASLFESGIAGLDLTDLPKTHAEGPVFLNVLRYLDMPQAVAIAAERTNVRLLPHREQQSVLYDAPADGRREKVNWNQFRGPNGQGLARAERIAVHFGPEANVVWKTTIPAGHSSPVIWNRHIFLTAGEPTSREELITLAIDREGGQILWRQVVQAEAPGRFHPLNHPASSTPAADERHVYIYFGTYGLLCYDHAGNKVWQRRIDPPKSKYGTATSPILHQDKVILVLDGDGGSSCLLAVHRDTGETVWEQPRPLFKAGWSTPMIFRHGAADELVVLGSRRLTSYDPSTGEEIWWAGGFPDEAVGIPVTGDGLLFAGAAALGGRGDDKLDAAATWKITIEEFDRNHDHQIERDEMTPGFAFIQRPELPKDNPGYGLPVRDMDTLLKIFDHDRNGTIREEEWMQTMSGFAALSRPTLVAIRPGATGDARESHVAWEIRRGIPETPSLLCCRGRLYLLRDGGLLTCLETSTGREIFRERIGAPGQYTASPIAAGDKIIVASVPGVVTVIQVDDALKVLARNDFGEKIFATPAVVENRIYLRTAGHLYALGE